jgi:hypothetical protein
MQGVKGHEAKCLFEQIRCSGCIYEAYRGVMNEHESICPEVKEECKYCKEILKRKDHHKHLSKPCKMFPIKCEFF